MSNLYEVPGDSYPCVMGMWCDSGCLGWEFENSTERYYGYDWYASASGVFVGSGWFTGTRGGVSPSMAYLES